MYNKFSLWCLVILALQITVGASAMEDVEMSRQTEMEHLMPLYDIWVVDRMCSNPRYQSEIGSSRMRCIRTVRKVLPQCNAEYRKKVPRNDGKTSGGRLRYRDFMAGYTRCLKQRHKEWRNAKGRLR